MSRLYGQTYDPTARWRNMTARLLSAFFRFGKPALVALSAAGIVPWWLIVLPVIPWWSSTITSTHEAHQRARIIRRPRRAMSLVEAAAERKFRFAEAAMTQADVERAEALAELANARAVGQQQALRDRLTAIQTQRRRSARWRA